MSFSISGRMLSLYFDKSAFCRHDSISGRYCGFDSVSVKEGEKVAKDDVLGTLGVIPIESADVTHLHFEMIKNGEYVDPIEALSMQREED